MTNELSVNFFREHFCGTTLLQMFSHPLMKLNKGKRTFKPFNHSQIKREAQDYSSLSFKDKADLSSYSNRKEATDSFFKPTSINFNKPELTIVKESFYSHFKKNFESKRSISFVSNEKQNQFHEKVFTRRILIKPHKGIELQTRLRHLLHKKSQLNLSNESEDPQAKAVNSTNHMLNDDIRGNYKRTIDTHMKKSKDSKHVHHLPMSCSLNRKSHHLKPIAGCLTTKKSKAKLSSSLSSQCFKPKGKRLRIRVHQSQNESKLKEKMGNFHSYQSVLNNNPLFQINPRIAYNALVKDSEALCSLFMHNLDSKYCTLSKIA